MSFFNRRGGEPTQPLLRRFNPALAGSARGSRTRGVALSAGVHARRAAAAASSNRTRAYAQSGPGVPLAQRGRLIRAGSGSGSGSGSAVATASPRGSMPLARRPETPSVVPSARSSTAFTVQKRPHTSPAPFMAASAPVSGSRPSTSAAAGGRALFAGPRPSTSTNRLPAMQSQAVSCTVGSTTKTHLAGPWWYISCNTIEDTPHGFQKIAQGYYVNRELKLRQWEYPDELRGYTGGDDPEEWQKLMKRRAREAELARKAAFEAKAAMAMKRAMEAAKVDEEKTGDDIETAAPPSEGGSSTSSRKRNEAKVAKREVPPQVFSFQIDPQDANLRSTTTAGRAAKPGGALNHNYRATAHLQQRLDNIQRFGNPQQRRSARPKWSVRKAKSQRYQAQRLM